MFLVVSLIYIKMLCLIILYTQLHANLVPNEERFSSICFVKPKLHCALGNTNQDTVKVVCNYTLNYIEGWMNCKYWNTFESHHLYMH